MSSLGEIRQFHEQLRLLSSAGIRLDLTGDGKGCTHEQLSAVLQRLEFHYGAGRASAAPHLGNSSTIHAHSAGLPHYEIALQCWLRTAGAPESLSILVDSEVANSRIRTFRHLRLIHPFSWAFIIGLSLLILARFYAPKAVSLANNIGISATWVDLLTAFRDSQIFWYIFVPVALLLFIALIWRRSSTRSLLSSDYGQALVRSAQVRQWVHLHAAIGKPREAWQLASGQPVNGDAGGIPETVVNEPEQQIEPNETLTVNPESNVKAPALVRWALDATEEDSESQPSFARRLALVHDGYETIEAAHRFRLRNVMPRGPVVVMGGLAIAALGIAMFYPIVQMLLFVSGELGQTQ